MIKSFFREKRRKFPDSVVNRNCSEFEVNKWTISDFILNNLIPVVGTHPFPLDELMLMSSAVIYFQPKYIFEWGTHIGKSARIFYETIKAFDIPCEIHSIDLPPDTEHVEHPKEKHGMLVNGLSEVMLHRGDGISKAIEIYQSLNSDGRTLFLIDGDHSYESVKRELGIVINEVNKPVVLLHDTFYQSEESGYNVGPFMAICDVLKGKPNKYEIIATQAGLPGMTLVFQK